MCHAAHLECPDASIHSALWHRIHTTAFFVDLCESPFGLYEDELGLGGGLEVAETLRADGGGTEAVGLAAAH